MSRSTKTPTQGCVTNVSGVKAVPDQAVTLTEGYL